jgi:hypothetical protein
VQAANHPASSAQARPVKVVVWLRDPSRVVFVAIILLGHAAAIHVLMVRIEVRPADQQAGLVALPVHLVPLPPPERATSPERHALPTQRRMVPPGRRLTIEPPREAAISNPSLDADANVRPDWAAQGERIARQWPQTDPGRRTFGNTVQDEPPDPVAPDIFENKSPRRAGYAEMIAPGVERRWISERCYREFGRPPDRIAGTRADLNPITCLISQGPVRSDLFDHLKPEYLKKRE